MGNETEARWSRVVASARERTLRLLKQAEVILDELAEQGSLDDQFEPREWSDPEWRRKQEEDTE